MTRTRWGSLLAGGVALLALTGCSSVHPGAAAQVGGTNISRDQVNDLSRIQCDLTTGQSAAQPRSQMAQATLNVLIESQIDNKYGKSVGASFDHASLQAQVKQFQASVAKLSKDDQAAIVGVFTDYARGRLLLQDATETKLKEQGVAKPSTDELTNEASQLTGKYADSLHIKIDPRYNPGKSHQAGGGDGSISVPVSSFAKSASGKASTSFVASLPTDLRCG